MLRKMLPVLRNRGGRGDCRGRLRRQPLHRDGYRQRGLPGHATHWNDARTSALQVFRLSNGQTVGGSWAARYDFGTLRQLGRLTLSGGHPKTR